MRFDNLLNLTKKTLLVLCSTLATLLLCELSIRWLNGIPVLSGANFRNERAIQIALSAASRYDRVLGWTITPHFSSDGFSTLEYGIRKNAPTDPEPNTGSILVVGSSFTAGSEVSDSNTWPAQLEQLLHERVLNAAVGGYSVDQIALRSQQLLPILRPKTLIVEAMDITIQWNSYSSRTRPKPYFTLDKGRLVAHNSPVPALVSQTDRFETLKNLAGHSVIIDRIMSRRAPDKWYASPENIITRIQSDDVEVSCRLLADLKRQADAAGVRMMLVTLVAGPDVIAAEKPPNNIALVEECSRASGLQVVSAFPAFRALLMSAPDDFKNNYVMNGETFGHLSAQGNRAVAQVVAESLASAPPTLPQSPREQDVSFVPGDGRNVVRDSESLDRSFGRGSIAEINPVARPSSPREFRIVAKGSKGEHYVGSATDAVSEGPYTLSFEVHPDDTPMMRAQLVDSKSSGVICNVDFKRQTTATMRIGHAQHLFAGIKPLRGGWYHVTIGGQLLGPATTIILQLAGEDGSLNFTPGKESLTVRTLQVERGQSASEYRPTSGARP